MYDRSTLQAVAAAKGDRHYSDLANRLGVAQVTGWRLWTGKTAPSVTIAAKVEAAYGLGISHLLLPKAPAK